jgi:hypothetical protein
MQARVEFFMERLVNKTLARDAVQPFESWGNERKLVVRFAARARACMACMQV